MDNKVNLSMASGKCTEIAVNDIDITRDCTDIDIAIAITEGNKFIVTVTHQYIADKVDIVNEIEEVTSVKSGGYREYRQCERPGIHTKITNI